MPQTGSFAVRPPAPCAAFLPTACVPFSCFTGCAPRTIFSFCSLECGGLPPLFPTPLAELMRDCRSPSRPALGIERQRVQRKREQAPALQSDCLFLTGGALARTRKAPHELDDARVLPVGGSDDFLGETSAAVEDVSLRKFEGTVAAGQRLTRVARNREGQALREHESFERCLVLVHADADHRHTVGAHLLRELLQTRRLLDAGRAPRRPEVQHHNLPVKIAQAG